MPCSFSLEYVCYVVELLTDQDHHRPCSHEQMRLIAQRGFSARLPHVLRIIRAGIGKDVPSLSVRQSWQFDLAAFPMRIRDDIDIVVFGGATSSMFAAEHKRHQAA